MKPRRAIPGLLATATVAAAPAVALAHGEEVHGFAKLLRTWATEPYVWIGLAMAAVLYAVGLRRTWRVGGAGAGVKKWEAWCYAWGWLALFIALASPLHPWGSVLFSAHMTQHEIMMLVGAPLLVLGRPLIVYLRALPRSWAHAIGAATNQPWWRATWHAISNPFVAWAIHAIALWMWHIPALFQATLTSELFHTAQHASFLGSALLFWWSVMHGRGRATAYGMAVLYMFTTAMHSGLLGVLITFAQTLIYPAYAETTQAWGLTPMEDQQLGGLIMWIPAGLVYVVAALAFMAGWLRESERRVLERETSGSARLSASLPGAPATEALS
jgi:cytochrome c oxidase assembly factor CtaG